jgi:SAM-dependent methyltransferase
MWPKQPPALSSEQQRQRDAFVRLWHETLPEKYRAIERFNHEVIARWPLPPGCVTLEIGGGLGAHSRVEDLARQRYYCLEYRPDFCESLSVLLPAGRVLCGDIHERQPWPDQMFDRIIAVHVLEHLVNLPIALEEIRRLVKPNGVVDIVLPCCTGARKVDSALMIIRPRA